jgi:hypothetical protein
LRHQVVDANSDFVVAIASVFIAIFTATLWGATRQLQRSTDKLWEAAEKQREDMKPSTQAFRVSAEAAR